MCAIFFLNQTTPRGTNAKSDKRCMFHRQTSLHITLGKYATKRGVGVHKKNDFSFDSIFFLYLRFSFSFPISPVPLSVSLSTLFTSLSSSLLLSDSHSLSFVLSPPSFSFSLFLSVSFSLAFCFSKCYSPKFKNVSSEPLPGHRTQLSQNSARDLELILTQHRYGSRLTALPQ